MFDFKDMTFCTDQKIMIIGEDCDESMETEMSILAKRISDVISSDLYNMFNIDFMDVAVTFDNYSKSPKEIRMVRRMPWEDKLAMRVSSESTTPSITKVIFNEPATIVLWSDNTKTVVKCRDEKFDKEKGLSMAIAKKMFGNRGLYYDEIKRWCSDDK